MGEEDEEEEVIDAQNFLAENGEDGGPGPGQIQEDTGRASFDLEDISSEFDEEFPEEQVEPLPSSSQGRRRRDSDINKVNCKIRDIISKG